MPNAPPNRQAHNTQASAHGSAAIVTGTGEVLAVPLIIIGRMLLISGEVLADLGPASQRNVQPKPHANGKPKLD